MDAVAIVLLLTTQAVQREFFLVIGSLRNNNDFLAKLRRQLLMDSIRVVFSRLLCFALPSSF